VDAAEHIDRVTVKNKESFDVRRKYPRAGEVFDLWERAEFWQLEDIGPAAWLAEDVLRLTLGKVAGDVLVETYVLISILKGGTDSLPRSIRNCHTCVMLLWQLHPCAVHISSPQFAAHLHSTDEGGQATSSHHLTLTVASVDFLSIWVMMGHVLRVT